MIGGLGTGVDSSFIKWETGPLGSEAFDLKGEKTSNIINGIIEPVDKLTQ